MCLRFLQDFSNDLKKKDDMIVAYKVISYLEDKNKFVPYHMAGSSSNLVSGKWYRARPGKRLKTRYIKTISKESYSPGFHCMLTLDDAKTYATSYYRQFMAETRIIKVYLKGIITTGVQADCRCVVARRMFIPNQEVKTAYGERCRRHKI